jgi:hypothetical protein
MGKGILAGIIGLIWVTIAVVIQIVSFLMGDIIAAITLLILVFITPYVLSPVLEALGG